MYRIPLFILLFLILNPGFSQSAFELEKMNVVYIGLPNPLHVAIDGYQRNQLILQTSSSCQIDDADSVYYLHCKRRGDASVLVKNKKGDTLAQRIFRIRSVPKPELRLGTLGSGVHSEKAIQYQPGVYATLGEGFAFEGVYYGLTSALVELETVENTVVCWQTSTAIIPDMRAHMYEGIQKILVHNASVHLRGTAIYHNVSDIQILSKEALPNAKIYSPFNREKMIPDSNTCLVIPHDSLVYEEEGKRHFIKSSLSKSGAYSEKVHLVDGDTILSIYNHRFKRWFKGKVLIEDGEFAIMDDSITLFVIQGAPLNKWNDIDINDFGDLSVWTQIYWPYYPKGEWKYFHANGKLKAIGKYKMEVNYQFDEWSVEKRYEAVISRTGLWSFYDEDGKLVEELNYDKK